MNTLYLTLASLGCLVGSLACLPRAADVDEMMQEVSLVAWRKCAALEDQAQFARWACLIARFEVLKYHRDHARDRLVLTEEAAAETPRRRLQLLALHECVAMQIPPRTRSVGISLAEHYLDDVQAHFVITQASKP